ncbi:MAG: O-antigen ligase family protein [Planctomycetes bacterium]|nr:O-antigen ligase family protein [Planctomycetota bacterium]
MAVVCLLFLYTFLAVQVIKWMPPRYAMTGASISRVANKLISNEIGYSRVNMSMMLSGASWALLAALPLARRWWQRTALLVLFPAVVYAQALTGGRMGYITWGAIGLILCMLRWRKRLILVPLVAIAIVIALPGVAERTFEGFGNSDVAGTESTDVYAVTAGRNLAWPRVVEKIEESPLVGFGRLAMERTGLAGQIQVEFKERFAHPHNAYLELLLDNGMVGFALIMPFYVLVVTRSTRLFLDRRDATCSAIGGITLSLVLAFLLASMGSQTFYPREGAIGMWAAIGLMLRVHLLRSQARVHLAPTPLTYGTAPPGAGVLAVSD